MKAERYLAGCPLFFMILMGPACAPSLRPEGAVLMVIGLSLWGILQTAGLGLSAGF
jgi:hypothetical protein